MSRIKDLRMKLTEEDILRILSTYGVSPYMETENALIFPTCCHNLEGGSPKLYYYKEDKIFKCYTACDSMFDIFELLIKMKKLRGEDINLKEAISLSGVEEDYNEISKETLTDLEYLRRLKKYSNALKNKKNKDSKINILDKNIINSYSFNEKGLIPWIEEGIGIEALKKFNIRYDLNLNAIIIPNLNHNGELIGIRGRFLNPDSKAKYMPLKYNGMILSHPTGKFFYGYYENKEYINRKQMAIIFEGEKSVLKMETLYPNNNIALSTSGKKITLDHLNALLKLNIKEVVLAYDRDYSNREEKKEKIKEYQKILQVLAPYFEISMLIDNNYKLNYKDSPIDGGKEIFEDLMRNRIHE